MTQLKAILSAGVMTIASVAIVAPASAQPVPEASVNACIQRTAEAMVVPARDIRMTNAGPVDVKGVRTLSMRNMVTGQTADCQVNMIDAFVLDVRLTSNPAPRPPQTVPQASINACIQQTAEAMVVATRDIELVNAGPISAETGVSTLNMRNRVTGQTATCRVNTITNTVIAVQLGGPTTPPPQRPPQTVPQASIDACIQRTAESMVVATRDIEFVSAGPISAESGMVTLSLRNRVTRQTATCRVNTTTNTVASVQLGGPTPPPNQGRPVPPTDPMARNCQANVGNKIRRSYGGIQQINFLSDTTRAFPISNTQESIRGEGQFRQGGPNWTPFIYNCTVNKRTGNVERATFNVLR